MSQVCVEFRDVEKRFGASRALDGASFTVRTGEVFGFIGPNGSGKTTAIRLMLDLYRPDRGSVLLFGLNPARALAEIGPRLGVVLEQPGLHEFLTTGEYLELYAGLRGLRPPEAARRCREALVLVDLSAQASRLVRTFSKGMRQRLAFARVLLNRPALLILDEPFDGIDAETRRSLLDLIPRVAREGAAVFLTSHNLAEVEQVCDRVAIVKRGRILACDRTGALRRFVSPAAALAVRPAVPVSDEQVGRALGGIPWRWEGGELVVEVGQGGVTRDEVLRRLLDGGISLAGLREAEASLESVYFALTGKEESAP